MKLKIVSKEEKRYIGEMAELRAKGWKPLVPTESYILGLKYNGTNPLSQKEGTK